MLLGAAPERALSAAALALLLLAHAFAELKSFSVMPGLKPDFSLDVPSSCPAAWGKLKFSMPTARFLLCLYGQEYPEMGGFRSSSSRGLHSDGLTLLRWVQKSRIPGLRSYQLLSHGVRSHL